MPSKCFVFNVYKKANVNTAIRFWENYSKTILSLGLKAKLKKNDNRLVERKQGGSKTIP